MSTEISKQQKLETLMMNNPSLHFEDACKLLGYNPMDKEIHDPRNPLSIFQEMFNERTK